MNESDAAGNTALIGAIFSGHLDICKYLLEECGADLTLKNNIGCSAMWIAAGYGHSDVLNYLIHFVINKNDKDAKDMNLELKLNLCQLLTEGNSSGDTPFLAAVSKGHDEIVKILFTASENNYSGDGNGNGNAWKLLSTTNNGGDTPLAVAVGMGLDGSLLHTLLDAEEKFYKNSDNEDEDDAEYARNRKSHLLSLSSRRRRRPLHSRNSKGLTPLLVACERNFKVIVETLVQRGADLSERDKKGRSPLAVASFCGCVDVVTYLLSIHGSDDDGDDTNNNDNRKLIDVNGQDENGCTALWLAARTGNLKMVELLVKAGVDGSIENKDGLSAQGAAIKYGKQQVIDFFSSSSI